MSPQPTASKKKRERAGYAFLVLALAAAAVVLPRSCERGQQLQKPVVPKIAHAKPAQFPQPPAKAPSAVAPEAAVSSPHASAKESPRAAAHPARVAAVSPAPAPRRQPRPQPQLESRLAHVVVNGISKGDATVYRNAEGAWLARPGDVGNWGLEPPGPARTEVAGEPYVALERLPGTQATFDEGGATLELRTGSPSTLAQNLPPSATRGAAAAPQPLEPIIARIVVNSVAKGDATVYHGAEGAWFARPADVGNWGIKAPDSARVDIQGERFVALDRLPELRVTFDERTVTLALNAAPHVLPPTSIDLAWRRKPGTLYPSDNSLLFNYNLTALGDTGFGSRSYQGSTEFAARSGNWLLYNTTSYQDGAGFDHRSTRLLTNAQYDDRANLRRFTAGDFFTPGFDLSGSVGMGGLSFTKLYSMDPYFVQYPTAGFAAQVALPSTVDVLVDGNLVSRQLVQPGPLDIRNVTAAAGQRNVTVIIRDPYGREQVLGQPFYFTQFGLAKGLQEYSYNIGALRHRYGVASDDYGHLAASGFHRYAFSDALTLGLRGEGDSELYNFGPFATVTLPRAGIVGFSVSGSERGGAHGHATGATYSYARGPFSLGYAGRYFSRDFAQLADEINPPLSLKSDEFANASLFFQQLGTFSVGYTSTRSYTLPDMRSWNFGYTRPFLDARAILSFNYTRTEQPAAGNSWLVSFTYYFDRVTSAVGRAGGAQGSNFQSVGLQKAVPLGQGYGYLVEGGRAELGGQSAAVGRGQFQLNAAHAIAGVDTIGSSDRAVQAGSSRAFVAGGIGYAGGALFASRPILDSFAVVRVGDVPGVPVYANGWLQGKSDAHGEVVATDLNAFYDNDISFLAQDLPLNYRYPRSQLTISPPNRSGSVVNFQLKAVQAVYGTLLAERGGKRVPLDLRELEVSGAGRSFSSFTAQRGEFYFEDLEPGDYALRVRGELACTATIRVRHTTDPFLDLGAVTCR
ncbi:MAG: fimbria/pilus outer membrane usher protein [Bacteroidota bacterium]